MSARDCGVCPRINWALPSSCEAWAPPWPSALPWGLSGASCVPFNVGVFIGLFLGLGLGYAVGESVSWAANRKRGPTLQGMAVVGVLLAYAVRNLVEGAGVFSANDVFGYVVVGVAAFTAIGRLR